MKYVIIILLTISEGCRVYVQNVDPVKIQNDVEEKHYNDGVKKLSYSLLSKQSVQELCDFKLILELIANSKTNFQDIEIDEITATMIGDFLITGYKKLQNNPGQISTFTKEELQKKLDFFLNELYKEGKKNNNKVTPGVFDKIRDVFCPLFPFC